MKEYNVAIIGAGLGGIVSAIELAKHNCKVCLIEANDRIGKKILASGNGKCNILNSGLSIQYYNNDFPLFAIEQYPISSLVDYYKELGLLLRVDNEGRYYPYCESATSVLNILVENLKKYNVEIYTNSKVLNIKEEKDNFIIDTKDFSVLTNKVILATGSMASFGNSSYDLFAKFGHKTTKLVQSLVPIKTTSIIGCNGVRSKVEASLYIDNTMIYKEKGEILFKDGYISGILAFQLSSYIARAMVRKNSDKINSYVELDFVPEYTVKEINEFISNSSMNNPLTGILHKAIAMNFNNSKDLAFDLKHYKCAVQGLGPINVSQVISGGLNTSEFNNKTMESNIKKGLYAIGEVLDVDGECGGFNLSFALLSALICSKAIIGELC